MPDVSVVIPTRDRGKTLGLALSSVLRQRDVELEVLVVDDGSTDEASEVVSGFDDPRIRLLRSGESVGVSAARNRGISAARAAWVAFLDDDDLWAPEKLQLQLRAATASGRAWVYGGAVNVDDHLRILAGGRPPSPERVMEALPRFNPIPAGASNVMVRSDALAAAGPFDTTLRRTEDWDLWIRLGRVGPPACVDRVLVAYRFHAPNIAAETGSIVEEPDLLAARYGISVDRAAMQRRAAWACLRAGLRGRALRYYARAIAMGDVASIGRAVVALLHPSVGSDRIFGLVRPRLQDEPSIKEAQAWIDELRREQSLPADRSVL